MSNISLDTTNFSEQLGLYDFFDVMISGSVFIFGVSMISKQVHSILWNDSSVIKGIGIAITVYIFGNIIQELGSWADKYIFKVKKRIRSTFLCEISDEMTICDHRQYRRWIGTKKQKKDAKYKGKKTNYVIENKYRLKHYRNLAEQIYKENIVDEKARLWEEVYNDEVVNEFIFQILHYRTVCLGRDAKTEKMRALYSLSRDLIVCFMILAICILGKICILHFSLISNKWEKLSIDFNNEKFLFLSLAVLFLFMFIFYFRMRRCKKYRALIMLGNYDASTHYQKQESDIDNSEKVDNKQVLIADELIKLHFLVKENAITPEEYEQRKDQLLKS